MDKVLDWGAEEPQLKYRSGRIFFTQISFKEVMNHMVNNNNKNNKNNSSNSLVFGLWPQTKKVQILFFSKKSRMVFCLSSHVRVMAPLDAVWPEKVTPNRPSAFYRWCRRSSPSPVSGLLSSAELSVFVVQSVRRELVSGRHAVSSGLVLSVAVSLWTLTTFMTARVQNIIEPICKAERDF